MIRVLLIVIIALVFPWSAEAGKPLPSVTVSINPADPGITPETIKPGDPIEFKVSARSLIENSEMKISVNLTGGADLISGETSWEGPVAGDDEKTLVFTVRAPEKGKGTVMAHVTAASPDGSRFSSIARYDLGVFKEPNSKAAQERPVKKDSRGRDIVEY